MNLKLYELTESIERLRYIEDEELEEALSILTGAFEEKAENIGMLVKEWEAEAAGIEVEWDRLGERKNSIEKKRTRLIAYLKANMEAVGLDKVKGKLVTVALQNSPPSCDIIDEEAIPWAYKERVESIKIDRRGIIESWKKGEVISGATVKQDKHIRIK